MNAIACRVSLAVTATLFLSATAGAAQPSRLPVVQVQQGRAVAQTPAAMPGASPVDDVDARQLREQFYEVLEGYPPSLGRVLKLDPSLMQNESYMSAYPAVAAFLAAHPGIARDPAYFLDRVRVNTGETWEPDERSRARQEIAEILAGMAAFVAFLLVTGVVVWVIRAIIENRRWNRVSKTQYDVHSKLLERFATNEELMAYIQTPVGRRFLESGPAPVPGSAQPVSAPFSRILWSVQVGIVLLAAGVGLFGLSRNLHADAGVFFTVFGVLALALGAGFIASGGAAWALSKRLGLLDRSDVDHA